MGRSAAARWNACRMTAIHIQLTTRSEGGEISAPGLKIIVAKEVLRQVLVAETERRIVVGKDVESITFDDGTSETELSFVIFG